MSIPIYSLPPPRPRTIKFAENVPTNPARRLIRPRAERLSLSISLAPLVSQRSILFRVQTEVGDNGGYDDLSSIETSQTDLETPFSDLWTQSALQQSEDSEKINMASIASALSVASAYSQESFHPASSADSAAVVDAENSDGEDAQTPTSSFPHVEASEPLPPARPSAETDEDERIFPRQWLSFSQTASEPFDQPSASTQPNPALGLPRRISVHARLLQSRRPAVNVPPLPALAADQPSSDDNAVVIPEASSDAKSNNTVDEYIPTRRRGLQSRASNTRSRENDPRRFAIAFSPSSAFEWERVADMGVLSPEETQGIEAALEGEAIGEASGFHPLSILPTTTPINHKLLMGLPEPRPISQVMISPPPSSSTTRYQRRRLRSKSKVRSHGVSGVPSSHHPKHLRTPRTPRTPGGRKQILSPNSHPTRARPARLLRPHFKKADAQPMMGGRRGLRSLGSKHCGSRSESLDEVQQEVTDEEDLESLPTVPQISEGVKTTSTQIGLAVPDPRQRTELQRDSRRATMINSLFSRLSFDHKALKRSRKTMITVAPTNTLMTRREDGVGLPKLEFSPISIDIPDIPLVGVEGEAQKILEGLQNKGEGEQGFAPDELNDGPRGLEPIRSLRAVELYGPSSTSTTSKPTVLIASPSISPEVPADSTAPAGSQFHTQRESLHPPPSFSRKMKGHKRYLSSPTLGGFKLPPSQPRVDQGRSRASAPGDVNEMPNPTRRTHRRLASLGSRPLCSPPPPLPPLHRGAELLPAIPPLPFIPSMGHFTSMNAFTGEKYERREGPLKQSEREHA